MPACCFASTTFVHTGVCDATAVSKITSTSFSE